MIASMFLFESRASEAARQLGLEYYGFGRWGNDRYVTHHTVNGVLVPYVRKTPKLRINGTGTKQERHPQVYEDENLMFHETAVKQKEFTEHLPTKAKSACLYHQVLHSIAIQSGIPVREMMQTYNPAGDERYGISLPKIIRGLQRHKVDGKTLNPVVHAEHNIDDAINAVRSGTPVICMVKTFGALMRSLDAKGQKKKFKTDDTLTITKPSIAGKEHLYHALMLVGFDKKNNKVLFRDSESQHARNGFFSVDYDYFKKTNPDEILSYIVVKPN